MDCQTPVRLRCGPLTVYVTSFDGTADLPSLLESLPSQHPVMWLDSARAHAVTGRWSMLAYEPWLVLSACGPRIELRTSRATHVFRAHPLDALTQVLQRYQIPAAARAHLGAAGRAVGLTGFLSYELNRWIERLPPPRPSGPSVPDMLWFSMQRIVLVDHLQSRTWLLSLADPHSPQPVAHRNAMKGLEQALAWLVADAPSRVGTSSPPRNIRCGAPGSVVVPGVRSPRLVQWSRGGSNP
jgi:anthranilate/para-aminobenzoate synthase component I